MKISVVAPIRDFDGHELRQSPAKEGGQAPVFTLGAAMTGALLAPFDGDKNDAGGRESFERFLLAERIHKAEGAVEITIEEAKTIKERSAKCYSTLVQGRIWQALEDAASTG